ncbi:hypothetical protein Glove_177g50 [Diversispora epigaea]|uniref:TLDc domain-containing protein n=1 Tax=Diversispora epigaea TaxID=1348612 RepID=A0A397INJ0_9GLOM|nr:hypothetical protein Glove_177g50 [Diversispora epigaea]
MLSIKLNHIRNFSINSYRTTSYTARLTNKIHYPSTKSFSRNDHYEFQLILRESKDGFAPRTFWNICHGHTNTIVITKVKGMNEIIGGFNPLAWDKTKDDWIKTNKSFIFSFKNVNNQNSILSRVQGENCALRYTHQKDKDGPIGYHEFTMSSDISDFTHDE